MCGINGFNWEDEALIARMNSATAHRGPDGEGSWVQEGVSLGHNRLAIIDVDSRAAQPMVDVSGRYHIVFNGEIYNYRELKKELSGHTFRTESDTEVILAAYKEWGSDCLNTFRGIFAFAIWDSLRREWFLARDQMGVKPLYYFHSNGKFAFSSELQSLLLATDKRLVNTRSLSLFFGLLYVPGPETLIEGIHKLMPGTYLRIKDTVVTMTRYWKPKATSGSLRSSEDIRSVIDTAVSRQLVSDRPVGIFLSGGLDSSILLHHAAKKKGIKEAFSVGFVLPKTDVGETEKFNVDSSLARKTAERYGIPFKELIIDSEYVAEHLVDVFEALDEPVSNPTNISVYALAKLAKETTPVVLGGDGGDELFGGYDRYRYIRMTELFQSIPAPIRNLLPHFHMIDKLNLELGAPLHTSYMEQAKKTLTTVLADSARVPNVVKEYFAPYYKNFNPEKDSSVKQCMEVDLQTWLVDESLQKTDRLTMRWGIEERVPFLDIDVVALALALPASQLAGYQKGKVALRNAYRGVLPEYLFNQPKRGWFSPGAKWLRHEGVKKIAKELLSSSYNSETAKIFDFDRMAKLYEAHEARRGYHLSEIWALMTFQVWARKNKVTFR